MGDLTRAIYKLNYGKDSDFSVLVKPKECAALVERLAELEAAESPPDAQPYLTGDPGDEQQE